MEDETDEAERVVETDPTGRFERFAFCLGKGAYKEAFDQEDGKEVAWNQLRLDNFSKKDISRILSEISILQSLRNDHIINLYHSWIDKDSKGKEKVVFITELMTSGTLKTYLKKTKGVIKPKVLKNWCKQILNGLLYLHTRNPIVIHRDLKAENIFINGNNGQAKIGDLGLAAFKSREHMSSVLGTPEFMAPELYDEKYDEKIDIYSFGMVVLEIVTKEYPYTECQNQAQIYKRVTAGTKPLALNKIADSQTRDFIELCILFDKNLRPTAQQLLSHAFLVDETVTNASTESSVASHSPHHSPAIRPTESQQTIEGAIFSLSGSRIDSINDLPSPMIPVQLSSSTTVSSGKSSISPASSILNEQLAFTTPLKEKTAIVDTDSHTFHITPRSEHASNPSQNVYIDVSSYKSASEILVKMIYVSPDKSLAQDIKFPFNLNEDTATDVISEMVNEKLIHADDEALCRRKLEELVRRVFINNGKKNSAGSLTDLQVTSGSQVSLNSDTLVAKPETEQYWITPSEQERKLIGLSRSMSNSSLEQIDLDRLLPRNNTVPRTIGQVSPQGPVRSPGARPFPASPNRSRSVMSPPPNRGKSQQRANNEELYNFPPNYQPYIRGKSNSSNSTDSSVGESTRLQNARVVAPAVPILQSKTDIRRLSSPATVGLSNSLAIEQSSNARSVSVDELEPVVLDANFVG